MKRTNPYEVPMFDAGQSQQTKCYTWWSWHPNYPYWSRSCWGGATVEEAWKSLESPWATSMRVYHNKLILESKGRFIEIADLPCQEMDVWIQIAENKNGWRKPTDAQPIENWRKLCGLS